MGHKIGTIHHSMRKTCWLLLFWALALWSGCRSGAIPPPAKLDLPTATLPPIGVDFATLPVPTLAVIEITPTPLPPPSPTPSPTPIVYLIEPGDTLLAIAWQRGNTVEEIVALNPGIQPELLQIGQPIVLPPPAAPLAQAAASTPVPLQLTIVQLQAYQTPVGGLWLLGEVRNEGALPAENVQVEFGLRDAAGNLVGTAVAWVAAPIIPAGETAPFGVLLPETPPAFGYPSVAVVGGQSVQDLGTRYLGLVVGDTAVTHQGERVQVTGWVQNVGAGAATAVRLILTLYDNQGKISGYAQQSLDTTILPGDNLSFAFDMTPPGGEPTAARLLVNAQLE